MLRPLAALASLLLVTGCNTVSGSIDPAISERGQPTSLLDLAWAHRDCTGAGLSTIRVIEDPRHGTIRVKEIAGSWTMHPSARFDCSSKRLSGVSVVYTPEKGFRGRDAASLLVISPDNRAVTLRRDIIVR